MTEITFCVMAPLIEIVYGISGNIIRDKDK